MRVSSQPGPTGVSFSPSCDSSGFLSYFLRTFIVNLSINRLVSLALCFLRVYWSLFVCLFVLRMCVFYPVFFLGRNWVRSGLLRSRPKAGLNMCEPCWGSSLQGSWGGRVSDGKKGVGGGLRCSLRKAEGEMVGWHHWLHGHEFEQTLGDGEGQGSLAYYSPWGCKESKPTEWLNNNNNNKEGRAAWRCPRTACVSQGRWGLHQSPCCSQPPRYAVDSQLQCESLRHWFGWVGRLLLMVRFFRNSPWVMV